MRPFTFLTFIAFTACNTEQEKPAGVPADKKTQVFEELGDLYTTDHRDTIPVYLSFDETDKTFEGVPLNDSLKKRLKPYLGKSIEYGEFFACFRFNVDASRMGLLTRQPSAPESSISLWIYNSKTDSLHEVMVLADALADAGETMDQRAWLCKGKDGKWNGYTYTHVHAEPTEGDEDTAVVDRKTFAFFVLEGNKAITKEITPDEFPSRFKVNE